MKRSVVALVALVALGLGCAPDEAAPLRPEAARLAPQTSLDGTLTAALPADLFPHPQQRALLATAAEGSFRLYLAPVPGEALMPAVAGLKDALAKQGWRAVDERHFEQAARIGFERGRSGLGKGLESRASWVVDRGGRLLLCEALATPDAAGRLGEPLKTICLAAALGR